jgi:predicted  nucleic acid-binding Zn-ribbon protein
MSMETVLKQLESKIDELVGAYTVARGRTEELERRVAELEGRLSALAEVEERANAMEAQRRELAERLHRVVTTVDRALGAAEGDGPEG